MRRVLQGLAAVGILAGGVGGWHLVRPAPESVRVELQIRDRTKPSGRVVEVRRGTPVTFRVMNDDPRGVPYHFRVVGVTSGPSLPIPAGEAREVTVTPDASGTYPVGCACGNHVDREATLVVRE